MEYRPLEVTVISADDLKNVNIMSKMDVYVVVTIGNDGRTKRRTPVDKDGGKNPRWNHRLTFCVDEAALSRQPNLCLLFKIRSDRPLGDRDIGEVAVPVKELFDKNGDAAERVVEYQVLTPSGKPKGTLKFSYKFGEKVTAPVETAKSKNSDVPVTAYPPGHAACASNAYPTQPGYGYAPAPPGYAHPTGYPPQPGYGYPPPQPAYSGGYPPAQAYGYPPQGYGYPPQVVQQPKKKKGNFGLGLGAGLLGGLLVGDMISDVGDMAAYDAGFDDAGFDF